MLPSTLLLHPPDFYPPPVCSSLESTALLCFTLETWEPRMSASPAATHYSNRGLCPFTSFSFLKPGLETMWTSDLDNPNGHNIPSLLTLAIVYFLGHWATWGGPETLCSRPVSECGLECGLKTQENLVPPRQGHRESTAQSPIPQLHMRQELHVIDITVPTAISVHLGTGG
jgi:hypothetical protein